MNFGYFELIDVIMIFTYALILIGMGIYFTRKSGTAEQFIVAGRSIPAWQWTHFPVLKLLKPRLNRMRNR